MSLILKENNPNNYSVVHLDNGVSFVHDNKTGKNYFNQEAISRIVGLNQSAISKRISRYKDEMDNIPNWNIALNVLDSTKPITFYDFDVVTYIVYRSNSLEAIRMRNYISNSIDEKFNKDVGFKKPLVDRLSDALNIDKVTLAERNKELESQVRTTSKINLNMTNQLSLSNKALEEAERMIKCYENEVSRLKQYEAKYKRRRTQKPVVKEVVVHMTLDEYMKTNGGDINEL